jgi:hypothetical protein
MGKTCAFNTGKKAPEKANPLSNFFPLTLSMEHHYEPDTGKKTKPKIDLYDLAFPVFLFIMALVTFFIYLHTPLYSGVREQLKMSVDVLEQNPRHIGKDQMMANEFGSSNGLMGSEITSTGRNVAAGCLLVPSLDGLKYVPVAYLISPSMHNIYSIRDLGFFMFEEDENVHFTQICDAHTKARNFTLD